MNSYSRLTHNWLAHEINNATFVRHSAKIMGRVVDLGCGSAPYRKDIVLRSHSYIGVDWPNSFHDQSKVDVFSDLTQGLPLRGECADTVVSFQVMEHLPEPLVFLSECFRILRPGGTLIITVPFMWHIHEAPVDFFRYTRYGLQYLLRKAGFLECCIEETTGFWTMWILKMNYFSARSARGLVRWLFVPFWWFGQVMGPVLDRLAKCPDETGGYAVLATKPRG